MISMLALVASGFLATTQTILVTEVPSDPASMKAPAVPPPPAVPLSLRPPVSAPTSLDVPREEPQVIEEEDLPPPRRRHKIPTKTGVSTWLGIHEGHPPVANVVPTTPTIGTWLGVTLHDNPARPEIANITPQPLPVATPASVLPPLPVAPPPAPVLPPPAAAGGAVEVSTATPPQAVVTTPAAPQPAPQQASTKLIPTIATNLVELNSQCRQTGADDVIKKSFREDSGVEPIQVSYTAVNPDYAKSLTNHVNNLNTMFPCMARMGTTKGDFTFFYEIKDIAGYVLVSGEVPAGQTK